MPPLGNSWPGRSLRAARTSVSAAAKLQGGARVGDGAEGDQDGGVAVADGEDRHEAAAEDEVGGFFREPGFGAGFDLLFAVGLEGVHGEAAEFAADAVEVHLPALFGEGVDEKASAQEG